ncbi:MAG: RNA polymerase sigma factor, partial [Faecalibacillus sp.]
YVKKKPVFDSLEHEKAWFIRVTINCSKTLLTSFWNNKIEEIHDEDITTEINGDILSCYLNKLSKKYNAVLYLFYYEGYSTKEIAHILNLKENNIRVLLNRARKKLKEEMMKDEKCI